MGKFLKNFWDQFINFGFNLRWSLPTTISMNMFLHKLSTDCRRISLNIKFAEICLFSRSPLLIGSFAFFIFRYSLKFCSSSVYPINFWKMRVFLACLLLPSKSHNAILISKSLIYICIYFHSSLIFFPF
jgi:hypothetical protein